MTVSLAMQIEVKGKDDASQMFNGIGTAAKTATGQIQGTIGGMTKVSLAMQGLSATLSMLKGAFNTVAQAVKFSVGAYMEGEAANQKLINAMKMTGTYTDEAMKRFQDLAQVMRQSTRFDDDAAISMMSLGKAAGYTDQTVRAMVVAAANFATITNQELQPAFEAMLGTFNGQTRPLAKYIQGLKEVSPAALSAGRAIDMVNEQMKDAAIKEDSLENKQAKLTNALMDLAKGAGELFVNFVDLATVFDTCTRWLDAIGTASKKINWTGLSAQIKADFNFIKTVLGPVFAQIGNFINLVWQAIKVIDQLVVNLDKVIIVFKLIAIVVEQVVLAVVAKLYDKIAEVVWLFGGASDSFRTSAEEMRKRITDLNTDFDTLKKGLGVWHIGITGEAEQTLNDIADAANRAGEKGTLVGEKTNESARIAADGLKKLRGEIEKMAQATADLSATNAEYGKTDLQIIGLRLNAKLNELQLMGQKARQEGIYAEVERTLADGVQAHTQKALNDTKISIGKATAEANILGNTIKSSLEDLKLTEGQKYFKGLVAEMNVLLDDFNKLTALAKDFPSIKVDIDEKDLSKQVMEALDKGAKESEQIDFKAKITPATDAINSATAGSKETLSNIFSKWGAIGMIIAGVIGFFNRPPDEFAKGVKELFDGIFVDLFNNIFKNIPALVKILMNDTIPMIFDLVFHRLGNLIPTLIIQLIGAIWEGLGSVLSSLLLNVMKGFLGSFVKEFARTIQRVFKEVFLGQKTAPEESTDTTKVTRVTTAYKKVTDTQAGREEFRIREYQAYTQTTESWSDKVKTVTHEGEESLWDSVRKIWTDFVNDIKEVFRWMKEATLFLTQTITAGIIIALGNGLMTILGAIAYVVGATIVGPIMATIKFLTGGTIGQAISEIDKAGQNFGNFFWDKRPKFKKFIETEANNARNEIFGQDNLAPTENSTQGGFSLDGSGTQQPATTTQTPTENPTDIFSGAGDSLMSGLGTVMDSSIFSDMGGKILSGLTDALSNAYDWAIKVGTKIFDALTSSSVFDKFKEWGGKIWDGFLGIAEDATKGMLGFASKFGGKIWDAFVNAIDPLALAGIGSAKAVVDAATTGSIKVIQAASEKEITFWKGMQAVFGMLVVWFVKILSTAFFTIVAVVATLFQALFIQPIVNLFRMLGGMSFSDTVVKSGDDLANTFNGILDQTEPTNKSMNEWYSKAMKGPQTTNTTEYLDENGNVITKEEWDASQQPLKKTRNGVEYIPPANLTDESTPRATSSTFSGLAAKSNPFGGLVDSIGNIGTKLWDGFTSAVTKAGDWFALKGQQVWDGLVAKFNQVKTWFTDKGSELWQGFVAKADAAITKFAEWGRNIWNGFWNAMAAGWAEVIGWFSKFGSAAWDAFKTKVDQAWDVMTKFGTWGKNIWDTFWAWLDANTSTLANKFGSFGQGIWDKFWNAFAAGWGSVIDWCSKWGGAIWDKFWNAFAAGWSNVVDWVTKWGGAIWDGFWNAFAPGWSSVLGWVKKWGGAIWDEFWNWAFSIDWNATLDNFGKMGRAIWESFKKASGYTGASGAIVRFGDWVAGRHFGGDIDPLHFATGGNVPGFGFTDSVPAMLTPGERVLTQSQARQMDQGALGGITINLHIAPNADVSESAIRRYLVPAVIDAIDRQSTTGKRFVNGRGVY